MEPLNNGALHPNAQRGSSCLDWVVAITLFSSMAAVPGFMIYSSELLWYGVSLAGAWLFVAVRMHIHIWAFGGMPGFCHLVKRFPATWLNTIALCHVFVACKLVQLLITELFSLGGDSVGRLYKCGGSELSLERYAKMCKDLNKPLIFRAPGTWWNFTIYPHMVSTSLNCNLYCMGPYTGFGILTILYTEHHIVFRNSLFGTHPAYNYHVTLFFTNDGEGYWHPSQATLQPVTWVYDYLWSFYACNMVKVIEESEARTNNSIEPPPPLSKMWAESDAEGYWAKLMVPQPIVSTQPQGPESTKAEMASVS